MRNHYYEVMWNYPDNEGWRDLHQYVLVFDPNSELGQEIDHTQFIGDKEIDAFSEKLYKICGLRDEDICFYYGTSVEPSEEELKKGVENDGDICIHEILDKQYIDEEGEK